jgi:chemotaxis signal transduction protein
MTGVLVVRSGSARYGMSLGDEVAVLDEADLVPVPGTHPAVRGVSSVRGRLVLRVDLQALLQGPAGPHRPSASIVVARAAGRTVAFEVDEVDLAAGGELLPLPPEWGGPSAVGVTRHGEELVPVLDLPALVSRLDAPAPVAP